MKTQELTLFPIERKDPIVRYSQNNTNISGTLVIRTPKRKNTEIPKKNSKNTIGFFDVLTIGSLLLFIALVTMIIVL